MGLGPGGCAKYADLVVVGKLSDIEENKFTFTCNKPATGTPYAIHFDVGVLKSPKILKGTVQIGRAHV